MEERSRQERGDPPGAAAMTGGFLLPATSFDVRRAFGVLWKWRWLVLAGGVVGFSAGLVGQLQRRPVYRASAQVLVERQGPKLLKFVDSDGWVLPPDVPFDTHARLMKTSPVAARVVKRLKLAEDPRFAPLAQAEGEMTDGIPNALIDSVMGGLDTKPSNSEFGMIDVSYTSPDAVLAARLANGFAEEYIESRIEASLGLSQNVSDWVDERLADAQAKLGEAEEALQTFREENAFLGPDGADRRERVASLRKELDGVVRQREEAQRLREQIAGSTGTIEEAAGVPEIASSELFEPLFAERRVLHRDIKELDADVGPKHPGMRKKTDQLATVEASLRAEILRIERATALSLERLVDREKRLREEIGTKTAEALHDGRRSTKYAALERNVEISRQVHETLLRRMKALGLAMDADRSNIRVVEPARTPRSPTGGPSIFSLLQAVAAGLLFAAGIAFLWEYFDSSVKTPEALEGDLRLPVLGVVPALGNGQATLADSLNDAPPLLTDAFGALRSSVVLSSPEAPPQVLLVTSPGAGEGKSTVALHLAAAMARDGVTTLLVEADLRHPVLHRRLGIEHAPGLTELLTSRKTLVLPGQPGDAGAVKRTSIDGLFLLPSGTTAPNPSELLGSARMRELIAEARLCFGRIIIDSPPVFAAAETLALADSTVLAAACDRVMLVVRARQTSREAVSRARSRLEQVRARVIGAVLNDWRRAGPAKSSLYYDGYGYGYPAQAPASNGNGNRNGTGTGHGSAKSGKELHR